MGFQQNWTDPVLINWILDCASVLTAWPWYPALTDRSELGLSFCLDHVCPCIRYACVDRCTWLISLAPVMCLNLTFFFFGSVVDWTFSFAIHQQWYLPTFNIMSGAAGLSGVADHDKSTEPTGFSRLNHPTYPSVCFHNSMSVLCTFTVNFNAVTVTPFPHIVGVLVTGLHKYPAHWRKQQTITQSVFCYIVNRFVRVRTDRLKLISQTVYCIPQQFCWTLTLPGPF